MPSASARRLYEDQIPPSIDPRLVDMEVPKSPANFHTAHRHSDSRSTQNSGSAESSPTTTASCTDDSSLSDISTSTSPDSPMDKTPPSFDCSQSVFLRIRPTTAHGFGQAENDTQMIAPMFGNAENATQTTAPGFGQAENATQRTAPWSGQAENNTGSLPINQPLSLRPKKKERKPGLRLDLPPSTASNSSLRLRSHQSEPALNTRDLKKPRCIETQDLTTRNKKSGLSEVLRGPRRGAIPEDITTTQLAVEQPGGEKNGEDQQQEPGYPDGPIAIYSDNVYLYLEPTAEEASKFDVVINVAREVRNPFQGMANPDSTPLSETQRPAADDSPIPDTAITTASFATAFEYPPGDGNPVTPRAATATVKQPEYIHIPWDHNTDISNDLIGLCEKIELRTKEGKKVLIHCQQGASRSASLIIAYGIWQNPEMSVNDAYHAAQAKSKWISPNMTLMYCLQDFRKAVSKKKLALGSGLRANPGRISPAKHRMTSSVDAIVSDITTKGPLTAPFPGKTSLAREKNLDEGCWVPGGRSSAPPSLRGKEDDNNRNSCGGPNKDLQALVQSRGYDSFQSNSLSEEASTNTIPEFPGCDSLLSPGPYQKEFVFPPLSFAEQGPRRYRDSFFLFDYRSSTTDPRSPPARDETPMGSIDEALQ